jgi:hypothetical protein
MNHHNAFLTRREMEWLNGVRLGSKNYEYKMKSALRKKLGILIDIELPLIHKSGLFDNDLTTFSKYLTTYGNVENSASTSNNENCAQKWWAGRDLNPRTPPCQGGILTKLDHRPVTHDKR